MSGGTRRRAVHETVARTRPWRVGVRRDGPSLMSIFRGKGPHSAADEELGKGASGPASGIPVSWLLAAMLLILAAQNLLLWRFLGHSSLWAYGFGGLAVAGLTYAPLRGWLGGPPSIISYRLLLFCLLLATALLLLGGQGRLFYANLDWQVRDAVLRDLTLYPWPYVYADRGELELLRAPLGIYLTPAALGKALGVGAAGIALLIQNIFLTGGFLAVASVLFETKRARIWAVTVFVLFSGMDIIGTWIVQANSGRFEPIDHIEFWSGLQYSSHITLLFWVPQHGLAGWIGALFFLLWRQEKVKLGLLLAAVPTLALWSPLAAMGVVPFAAYAGMSELLRRRIRLFDLAVPAVAVLLAAPGLAYLAADGDSVGMRIQAPFLVQFATFTALEVLPFVAAVLILTPRPRYGSPDFVITAACLILIPFVRVGEGYDFMMRVSIPAFAILAVLVADALSRERLGQLPPFPRLVAYCLILTLLIGMATPLLELRRAFAFRPPPMTRCNLINSANQVSGLDKTSGSTYFASLEKVPALIRPADPAVIRERGRGACWSRPWQTPA